MSSDDSAVQVVTEKLLRQIIGGHYGPGTRLPAERDLVTALGSSRITIRAALRQLENWNVVHVRRGSGATVRDWKEWSLALLPAWLRHGRSGQGRPGPGAMLRDILSLRRDLILASLRRAAGGLKGEGLDEARALAEQAWQQRKDPVGFARLEFSVFKSICAAAGMWSTMWLFNDLYETNSRVVAIVGLSPNMPDDYLQTMNLCFDALENGQGDRAVELIETYLEQVDAGLLKLLALLG
jgi:DNA-binding FadR family transcriptional regulator